jgi:predicted GIY-YIG superfamily endonuclease
MAAMRGALIGSSAQAPLELADLGSAVEWRHESLRQLRPSADGHGAMASASFPPDDALGTIYLLHYSGRTKEGRQHYLGWSSNTEARFAQHRSGWGSGETKKAVAEGLKITQAQTWKGTPLLERRLKEWSREGCKGFSGICPFCPREDILPSDLADALGPSSLRVHHQHAA